MRPSHGRANARCPQCGSLERHRVLWLFLRDRTPLFSKPLSVLRVAPESQLEARLRRTPNRDYTSADIEPTHSKMARVDITNIPFREEAFVVIICNHVLEHVPDDRHAMAEL
jgi:hypothetical protein